jgi:hypothetical protein
MGIGSISFWQQDQNYWTRVQQQDQTQSTSAALITAMGNAVTTRSQGLSSLANQTALSRVNTALTAAIQGELQATQSGSTSSSSNSSTSSSSASSSSSSSSTPVATFSSPAIGTGTVPLTAGTQLQSLGIIPGGAITVSDNTFTTTYVSTGTDTVGDLINAINTSTGGNANVAAWLNSSGDLVISGKTDFDSVTVGGAYALNVGFGASNDSFQPTTPPSATSSTSSSSNSSGSATSSSATGSSSSSGTGTAGSSGTTSTGSAPSGLLNSSLALQTGGTAEFLLASNGLAGTLLNMIA